MLNLDNLFLPEENLFSLGIPVVVVHRLYVATCAQKCYLIYHSEENVTRHSMWSSINGELGGLATFASTRGRFIWEIGQRGVRYE